MIALLIKLRATPERSAAESKDLLLDSARARVGNHNSPSTHVILSESKGRVEGPAFAFVITHRIAI
jgi:hypothetical protein